MFLSRIYYAIAYLVVLILEIIKSTIDMCLRIFKSNGFEPIVIDIDTELKRPISQTIGQQYYFNSRNIICRLGQ